MLFILQVSLFLYWALEVKKTRLDTVDTRTLGQALQHLYYQSKTMTFVLLSKLLWSGRSAKCRLEIRISVVNFLSQTYVKLSLIPSDCNCFFFFFLTTWTFKGHFGRSAEKVCQSSSKLQRAGYKSLHTVSDYSGSRAWKKSRRGKQATLIGNWWEITALDHGAQRNSIRLYKTHLTLLISKRLNFVQ